MIYNDFNELIEKNIRGASKKNVAVICAEEAHTLEAVMSAGKDGIAHPILIGNREKIEGELAKIKDHCEYTIIHAADTARALEATVDLVKAGETDAIMKGLIQTSDMMNMVVNKESGLRTGNLMSHLLILKVPTYHKLLAITDVAMVTYPDLEQKKKLLLNATGTLKSMGFTDIKAAVLAAVDHVNPKMPESVEAAELKKLGEAGEIPDCIVEGPIPYDLAIDKESSLIKGYTSPVAGDPDILLCPNITAGNILAKSLVFSAKSVAGAIIVGAKVPIILTSRASSSEEKYHSIVLASSVNKTDQGKSPIDGKGV